MTKDSDRELLEKAAKAAGLQVICHASYPQGGIYVDDMEDDWNPITDDGDALRLAVKLRLMVCVREDRFINAGNSIRMLIVPIGDEDPCTATRRAIVRAAAEIGRAKP